MRLFMQWHLKHFCKSNGKTNLTTRVRIQRLDPNGDPTRNPTRSGRVESGQTFYTSGFFGSSFWVEKQFGFFRVNPRKSWWNPNFLARAKRSSASRLPVNVKYFLKINNFLIKFCVKCWYLETTLTVIDSVVFTVLIKCYDILLYCNCMAYLLRETKEIIRHHKVMIDLWHCRLRRNSLKRGWDLIF